MEKNYSYWENWANYKRRLHLGRMPQEKKNQVGAYLIIRIE